MTAFARRYFAGGATATTLASSMSSTDSTFTITADTGWPGSPSYNFFVVIDRDTTAEEKILCASNSGTTVTVASGGRGSDGTTATAHNQNSTVEVCITAIDGDEANQVTNLLGNLALCSLPVGAGSATLPTGLTVGTDGDVLTADSTKTTGLKWAPAATPAALAPGGLTGATAATRYVGGTTSGAPTAGTFDVGDFVIDQTGVVWICTTAGTPGTWTKPSGGAPGTTVESYTTATVSPAVNTWTEVTSVSLVAGTWLIMARACVDNGGSASTTQVDIAIGPNSGSVTGVYASAQGLLGTSTGAYMQELLITK